MNDNILVIGAGPAGLAAAYELAKNGKKVTVLEKENQVGGISKTIVHDGYRFDIGGHRFFTKSDRVNTLWNEVLGEEFLTRPRCSHIFFKKKFFNYPLKASNVVRNLGVYLCIKVFLSYLSSRLKPYQKEDNFEEWVSNRFGKELYRMFFKTYTEKVWGIPCNSIDAQWAAQRIKGLSFLTAVKNALFTNNSGKIKTLITKFNYPKFGPGQMYEAIAKKIEEMGGKVVLNSRVVKLEEKDGCLISATDEKGEKYGFDYLISSMPIDELVVLMDSFPEEVKDAARGLEYRSLLTVNLVFSYKIPLEDTWLYIHEPDVHLGRIQVFHNWSPYLVPDNETSSLGLEYFCYENDHLWSMKDNDLIKLGKDEISRLGLADEQKVMDAFVVRTRKTYPMYSNDFKKRMSLIRESLKKIVNIQPIGRYGMFKYNNMDHSILTGIYAAENILGSNHDVWQINTEPEYHEEQGIGDRTNEK
ncbi:MAG: NAD(P)/FAD-dependent oxidoreductase [Candidatus Coatesbacteria bacterium]|nr:NAD(P)/FAD-dependent oxidoreductase [Candidatus Coatesbacteria bacterium]